MAKQAKYLGIDPGTGRCGWGVIEGDHFSQRLLQYGCIETPAHTPHAARLVTIRQSLITVIDSFQPEYAAVEQLYFTKNITTGIRVAQARGVILCTLAEYHIPVVDLTPQHIKSVVTGHGKASKTQVQRMVKALLGMHEIAKPDDAADALAVAIAGCVGGSFSDDV